MKQVTMAFSAHDIEQLARMYTQELQRRKVRPNDPTLNLDVDLLFRLEGAAVAMIGWGSTQVFTIPWVVPVLHKAIADANKVSGLEAQVKQLQLQLKEARKPAAKAKGKFPRRKRSQFRAIGPDGRFLPRQQPEASVPEPVAAAPVEATTT